MSYFTNMVVVVSHGEVEAFSRFSALVNDCDRMSSKCCRRVGLNGEIKVRTWRQVSTREIL
jgi:hypothetical protein